MVRRPSRVSAARRWVGLRREREVSEGMEGRWVVAQRGIGWRRGPGPSQGRARAPLARVAGVAIVVAMVAGVGASPAAAELPAPTDLRIAPHIESLVLRWGVASTEGLAGFRVRWRPVSLVALPWSPAVTLPATRRLYTITGLAIVPYEVTVRSFTTSGKIAGTVKGVRTPLPATPSVEEPPVSGVLNLKIGLDSGGWPLTDDAALNSGKLKLMRGQNMSAERLATYEAHGWKMIDLIGHNPATSANPESLASEAVARAKAHPAIIATEILNEPQNPYLGGSESQANIEAYARVVNTVAKRLHESTSSVPLWSADGGYAGVPSWGAKVWPLLDAN